jgi:hypothetical protein
MGELSPSDAIALAGNGNNDGFGGNGNGWWIILLFMIFGWGGNRGYGNNGGNNGYVGGDLLYPWLNQSNQINDGFRDQMMNGTLNGIQQSVTAGFANAATQLCQCCADMQMALCNGFNNVNTNIMQGLNSIEAGANARQMANMQQQFAAQMQMQNGFTGLQYQTADQTATILAEHCADRAALSDGVRDIITSQQAGTQRILDQMCQDKIDAKNEEIANLRQQINMMNLAASQAQQTQQLLADNFAQTNALEQYLAPVPRPAYIVQNPNCCQQNYGGCGCGFAA